VPVALVGLVLLARCRVLAMVFGRRGRVGGGRRGRRLVLVGLAWCAALPRLLGRG